MEERATKLNPVLRALQVQSFFVGPEEFTIGLQEWAFLRHTLSTPRTPKEVRAFIGALELQVDQYQVCSGSSRR